MRAVGSSDGVEIEDGDLVDESDLAWEQVSPGRDVAGRGQDAEVEVAHDHVQQLELEARVRGRLFEADIVVDMDLGQDGDASERSGEVEELEDDEVVVLLSYVDEEEKFQMEQH